jgi:ribosomal protein S18 acetylase RimI-like enzyme
MKISKNDLRVKFISIHDIKRNALFVKSFRNVKLDSLICRMPRSILQEYFSHILNNKGHILVAYNRNIPVGFLIYVSDNNLSLNFIRNNKFMIMMSLLFSLNLQDKLIFLCNILNAFLMIGKTLPKDFKNEISLLAVNHKFTGNGIGNRLLKKLSELNLPVIRVKTHLDNLGAIRFYENNGFYKYGIVKIGIFTLVKFKKVRN